MTTVQRVHQDKKLKSAFKTYQKRYLSSGKKPANKELLSEAIYRTMRLEGEKVTRRQTQALFK